MFLFCEFLTFFRFLMHCSYSFIVTCHFQLIKLYAINYKCCSHESASSCQNYMKTFSSRRPNSTQRNRLIFKKSAKSTCGMEVVREFVESVSLYYLRWACTLFFYTIICVNEWNWVQVLLLHNYLCKWVELSAASSFTQLFV